MPSKKAHPGLTVREVFSGWWNVLNGRAPMLSIEITRECPLRCPGCYAYGETHLGDGATLRDLSDFRGDALVNGVLDLVRKHRPLHVSLVGGEPLIRHRELSRILPALSAQRINTLVVTSAVIPIPEEWMSLARFRVAVSVDGLPEHHDVRRAPATYERILQNISGRRVNVHWTITRPMMQREDYLEEYVAFWSARPEIQRIWVSLYTPQKGENTPEMLTSSDRQQIALQMPSMRARYPKLLMHDGIGHAILNPPSSPEHCVFSRMSINYSADLDTRVEPCIFGGTPDCSQCGCATTTGLQTLEKFKLIGPLRVGHLIRSSISIGAGVRRIRRDGPLPSRWRKRPHGSPDLVQIGRPDRAA